VAYVVPLSYNSIGAEEIEAATAVLRSGFVTQGSRVADFEREFAARHGVAFAIFVNSGSSANLVAIEAVIYLSKLRPDLLRGPIVPGDEVIIQGLNWPSTIKPMTNHGLTPVFCDIRLDSLNASVADVQAVRTPRTRMVVAVPVLGNPSHVDDLRDYCADEDLLLLEDACESLGAVTESNELIGTLGSAAAFSFYFSHHITTIEGGMILTDDPHLADLCFALRAHGWSRNLQLEGFLDFDASHVDPRFCFVLPGYNVRSTDVNAAIGQVQLRKLDDILAGRQAIADARIEAIQDLGELVSVPGSDLGRLHSRMTLPLMFANNALRDRARISLEADGIETRPIIVGNMLRHPLAKNLNLSAEQRNLPKCDAVFERGLMIGLDATSDESREAFVHRALRRAAYA
jgi:CDP-6-deoxy-D-xylo-4-hexulose-3-dehydrase